MKTEEILKRETLAGLVPFAMNEGWQGSENARMIDGQMKTLV